MAEQPTNTITPEEQEKLITTGRLFHMLAADPRHRKEVLGLIKKAAPDTPIPELDLEDSVTKRVEDRLKPKEEELAALRKQIDELSKQVARKEWREKTGLSEEECVEVEAIAKEGQIGKAETAVEFWRAKQALGTPRNTRRAPVGTQEYMEKINKTSPRATNRLKELATTEAVRVMDTLRRGA